ncbi:tRNA1(Val) (adenine(37)-N6)-methyltransferase [Marivita sp. S2033]|uniref:tRNA1(Val) (adenine(37)-N6)-methyltransferase n=1 Tax=Marivita sp. S2033 TaxID=3373187 RepID=UPI003981BF3F
MRIEPFGPDELTRDDFLGGIVRLWQPKRGYRAGLDPVLLAASVPASEGDSVLDLGCGGGAALACLAGRVTGIECTGIEMQPAYAELAQRNLTDNGLNGQIHCADITDLPPAIKARRYAHIIANPPYFETRRALPPTAPDRAVSRSGELPLAKWVSVASKRLEPGGTATFIQRAERLPELMSAFYACLGALELWPIQARAQQPARLVLVRGRKGRRAAFVAHPPLVLHRGDRHEADGDSYTELVSNVLRRGESLPFPGNRRNQSRQS